MNDFQRHFCVTVYVFDKKSNSFLFIRHKKLNKWLPPGGHIEPNETPEEAAKRECFEETGVEIEIVGKREEFNEAMITPLGIQLNIIEVNKHEHMDLIYQGVSSRSRQIQVNYEETTGAAWINMSKILSPEFDTFPSIPYWCKKISSET